MSVLFSMVVAERAFRAFREAARKARSAKNDKFANRGLRHAWKPERARQLAGTRAPRKFLGRRGRFRPYSCLVFNVSGPPCYARHGLFLGRRISRGIMQPSRALILRQECRSLTLPSFFGRDRNLASTSIGAWRGGEFEISALWLAGNSNQFGAKLSIY